MNDHYTKAKRAASDTDDETWKRGGVSPTLNAMDNTGDTRATVLIFTQNQRDELRDLNGIAGALQAESGSHQTNYVSILGDVTHSLTAEGHDGRAVLSPTLTAHNDPSRSPQSSEITAQIQAMHEETSQVRRLTPVECERLQGFPDNWTDGQADSARYRQMGNAVAVPVVEWIMRRVVAVDEED